MDGEPLGLGEAFSRRRPLRSHGGPGPTAHLGHHLLPGHRGSDLRGARGAALERGQEKLLYTETASAQGVPVPGPGGPGQDLGGEPRSVPLQTLEAGQSVRSAEGNPFTALDNSQSPWVVLGMAGKDVSHGSGCWDLSVTRRHRSHLRAGTLWEPSLSREKLGLTPE